MPKARLIAGLLAAEIFAMAGFATFASLLVQLSRLWQLSPAEAGWIGSAYLIGYAIAVPALVGLTDRVDSRAVYLAGCLLGVAGGAGFASLARGFWSACAFRALAGMSLAGTYMPGLRIVTERLEPRARVRSVPYYTAMFGVGVSLSFWLSGPAAQLYGWRGAFWASAMGSVIAAALVLLATAAVPVAHDLNAIPARRHPLDFRPVLGNREAIAYVLAYAGHAWELFGFRAWLAAYLLFVWDRLQGAAPGAVITNWATLITVASLPASIIGAEFAMHGSRDRLIRRVAASSAALGLATVLCGTFSFAVTAVMLFVYGFAISADSGALTAGMVAIARPGEQGAALAVYSLMGFGGGAIGPLAAGVALDLGGGLGSSNAWLLAFAAIASGSALAAMAISLVPAAKPGATNLRALPQ